MQSTKEDKVMTTQQLQLTCLGSKKRNSKEFWKALKALRKSQHHKGGIKLKQIDFSVRARYLKGLICCDKCRKNHLDAWQYTTKSGGLKNLCRFCRGSILDIQKGKRDALNHAVSGGGFGTKR